MVQWRIGQLQQPAARRGRRQCGVAQIEADPEHRGRVTGIQYIGLMRTEMLTERRGTDLRDAGIAIAVFEYLHHSPQGQAARRVVEIDRRGQQWQPAQHNNQQIAHTAPAWSVPVVSR
ncbi:hypothetical protein D3C81_1364650 [compost metagenome]